MSTHDTAAIIRAYYDAWTAKDFDQAVSLLAAGLTVEVPVNVYPTTESFAAALKSFGSMTTKADLLAAMSAGNEGMVLYDMDVQGLGTLRVAEHFTVEDGKITRVRQIHDTAALRTAGFVN
jgi:ketosteroid isomerase-like protein